MMRRVFSLLFLLGFLASASQAQQPSDAPKTKLLPNKTYSITIKRVYGGNDGFKDVIPGVSTQGATITTTAEGDGVAMEMKVYRPFRSEEARMVESDGVPMWTFRCTLGNDGAVRNLTGVTNEGEMPAKLVAAMFGKMFDEVLFSHPYTLELKNKRQYTFSRAQSATGLRPEWSYQSLNQAPGDITAESEPLSVSIEGTAVFDNEAQCYVERRHAERQSSFIAEDARDDNQHVVKIEVTSTYLITVSDTKH